MSRWLFITILSLPIFLFSGVKYKVNFLGLENKQALSALKASSDLLNLQKRPPASVNSLRYRIDSDVPTMIKALQAFGYYDASISSMIENEKNKVIVTIFVHAGPQYELETFEFYTLKCKEKKEIPQCPDITLETLGIVLGGPAYTRSILDSQDILLRKLANCGYPLAAITSKDILVDNAEKKVRVHLCIDIGKLSRFGPLTISGLKDVDTKYLARKVQWKEGEIYNEELVEETQRLLIDTDLFSSVLISHAPKLDAAGQLPMKLQLSETKHKSVSLGASFATMDGFGAVISWENRNVFNMGQRFNVNANISRIYSAGTMSYTIPDFLRMDQFYIMQATLSREHVTPYLAETLAFENRVDRKIRTEELVNVGVRVEYIDVRRSIRNQKYTLLALPIFYQFAHVENILNPLSGLVLAYLATPYQAITHKKISFIRQTLTLSTYLPFDPSNRVVLALRAQAGSIVGTGLNSLPMNKRFLGGSDEELRGYKFKTVSPLNSLGNPTGGRGALYGTAELRLRLTEKIGLIGFYDIGNVTEKPYPVLEGRWLRSAGVGLRYFLFFGPLRVDVGFPIDPRPFDPFYRTYISIGQTF